MDQPERITKWHSRWNIRLKETLTLPSADRAMHLRMVVFPAFGRPMTNARNRPTFPCNFSRSILELCQNEEIKHTIRWERLEYLLHGCPEGQLSKGRGQTQVRSMWNETASCYSNSEILRVQRRRVFNIMVINLIRRLVIKINCRELVGFDSEIMLEQRIILKHIQSGITEILLEILESPTYSHSFSLI
jgi:hypothetical protein